MGVAEMTSKNSLQMIFIVVDGFQYVVRKLLLDIAIREECGFWFMVKAFKFYGCPKTVQQQSQHQRERATEKENTKSSGNSTKRSSVQDVDHPGNKKKGSQSPKTA